MTRDLARRALAWPQPFAMEALGIHAKRQTLVDGELPAYVVATTPETNGGWGELMPVWFRPYDRPVPLHCLDNWALFALLYRSALRLPLPLHFVKGQALRLGSGSGQAFDRDALPSGSPGGAPPSGSPRVAGGGWLSAFTVENLARVVLGADLLVPFLPGTDGAGRFLRHGALPILLAILWLKPEARDAWLALHERGAREFALDNGLGAIGNLGEWLEHVESEAWLAVERGIVAGEASVGAFLADADRVSKYALLFGGLCLGASALAAGYGVDWRKWVFQAVNVGYRLPDFGLRDITTWLKSLS